MLDLLLDIVFPRICRGCGKWGKYVCDSCRKSIEYLNPPAGGQVCPYCEKQSLFGLTHPRCQKAWGLDGMFVLAHYRGIIPKIIHEVKYNGHFGVLGEIGEMMINRYHGKFDFDYFVPIPLHKNREWARGFNQAEVLAKELARMMNEEWRMQNKLTMQNDKGKMGAVEVLSLLIRTRETKPQFDLKMEERAKNIQGAFEINSQLISHNSQLTTNNAQHTSNNSHLTSNNSQLISYSSHLTSNNSDLIGDSSQLIRGKSICLVDDVATTGATIFEAAKVLKKAGAQKVWAMCLARGG